MATATLNPVLTSISGRIGSVVFYSRYNKQCIRQYVIPRNPDTIAQRHTRNTFANAVRSWQALPQEEKYRFNRKARYMNMSGYNLYISGFMNDNVSALNKAPAWICTQAQAEFPSHQLRFPSVSYPIQRRTCGCMQIKLPVAGFTELLL